MARIAGVDIPNNKRMEYALTYIKGVGLTTSRHILKEIGVDINKRAKDLTEDEVSRIAGMIDKHYLVEGALTRQIAANVQRLKEIGAYRGARHRRNLPARGQRTRTNARTRKGPKKTVAGKKPIAKK